MVKELFCLVIIDHNRNILGNILGRINTYVSIIVDYSLIPCLPCGYAISVAQVLDVAPQPINPTYSRKGHLFSKELSLFLFFILYSRQLFLRCS